MLSRLCKAWLISQVEDEPRKHASHCNKLDAATGAETMEQDPDLGGDRLIGPVGLQKVRPLMIRHWHCYGLVLLIASTALARQVRGADDTRQLVVFRNGYVIEGRKVEQDKDLVVEGHVPIVIEKGTFALDADARIYSFPVKLVGDVLKKPALPSENIAWPAKYWFGRPAGKAVNPVEQLVIVKPFNYKPKDPWDRLVSVDGLSKPFRQRLMRLTPRYAQVYALDWPWRAYYLTSEIGPELALSLIEHRPKQITFGAGTDEAAEKLAIYRFFVQAGWYPEAETQLDAILKKYPKEKKQVADLRRDLKGLQANQLYKDLKIAYQAGQHQYAQTLLARFPIKDLDAGNEALAGIGAMRAKYKAANASLTQVRRFLGTLPASIANPGQKALFTKATAAILTELSLDDFLDANPEKLKLGRLDPFLELAEQAEREKKLGQTPTNTPEQLLSVAVSGWLLGKDGVDKKPETAKRLWATREFLLTYFTTATDAARKNQRDTVGVQKSQYAGIDEIAQMLKLLPPAEGEPRAPATATELVSRVSSGARRELNYIVQLPPEYHVGRAYPLLIALHSADEKPRDMLERCGALARKYGFILAAPAWSRLLDSKYGFTPEEHAAVTDLLVDVRRRFQVDSDRVFLLGAGDGANMAYDIGLAHPDLFAGVIPIAGAPIKFAREYWPNAQYLPFYVVDGENAGTFTKDNLDEFKHWILRGYPALHVIYRGRGIEWFGGELPDVFTWMMLQHRALAGAQTVPQLGDYNNQFQTLRTGDNHFYWLGTDSLDRRRVLAPGRWDPRRTPASFYARVGQNNEIIIYTHGFRNVTVWLGRDMMIDFEHPIRVVVNSAARWHSKVQPDLATLLEDYYKRADRQRLYLARLNFDRVER